jgi:hypothetical protein
VARLRIHLYLRWINLGECVVVSSGKHLDRLLNLRTSPFMPGLHPMSALIQRTVQGFDLKFETAPYR